MKRLVALALAVATVVIFGSATALGASPDAVAIVTASPASDSAARYLTTQIDLPTTRRKSENARHLDLLVVEARAKWPEDLVVVVDSEQGSVSVVRPSDGTIGSRALSESATRAPYAVALAAVELLEIVRNAPAAHTPVIEPRRVRSLVLHVAIDVGLVQSVGASGNLGLLEPTVGVDVEFSRRSSPVLLLAGVHASGLAPSRHDLTLLLPSGDDRGYVDYVRDELSARFGVGHRQGPSAVLGWADVGVAFIQAHAEDAARSYSASDHRAAIWLGLGAELRYTVVGGFALGIGAGVAYLPVASRFLRVAARLHDGAPCAPGGQPRSAGPRVPNLGVRALSWAPEKLQRSRAVTAPQPPAPSEEKSSIVSSSGPPRVTHRDVDQAGALFVGPVRDRPVAPVSDAVDRARAGDPLELQAIARRELPRVERLLRRLLGPRSDMEDLVQNVFVEMCRALPTFRGESTISTFVGGITVQIARRAMRPAAWVRFRSPMPEHPPPGPDRTDDNAVAMEQLRRVDLGLAKISPDKRIAFVLWAIDGKDVETIAEMVGASVPATRSRIHYAQRELKAYAAGDPYLSDLVGAVDDG